VVTFANSALIVALAARYRLPAIYPFAFFVREGGLLSYGFDAVDQFRQAAIYVNKILRGVEISELPVQHPATFELALNLRTAQALGLEIPRELLLLADELIE
jgi:putative ABC transport system substrate-binding protein